MRLTHPTLDPLTRLLTRAEPPPPPIILWGTFRKSNSLFNPLKVNIVFWSPPFLVCPT